MFPWGAADPSIGANADLANDPYSNDSPYVAVGSHPSGNGKWGHFDLAGEQYEWTLDGYDASWYSGGGNSCNDCANLDAAAGNRVLRGGNYQNPAVTMRAAYRLSFNAGALAYGAGVRCARTP